MERHCAWIMTDPDYIAYHDQHWGRPEYDNRRRLAMLGPEGQRPGLSWRTIRKRMPEYHLRFADFDPLKLIEFDEGRIDK